ncbi:FtsX-like permease family protein [Streptomyces sp. XM4193]|uniref:ABC transporter permease n=1 Tax=Streptomyces sp. XM4193 TaxID=2929782 RepID=UPI001FFA9BB2|nr:FtsX-like permease family protein [Streptomyces sp. XM4193]MCK1795279.1 FtsX-like permease family protein [Streptomyces sp. XM4193]
MLALANLREHRRAFVAAFLAVLVGVGLITATLVVHDSSLPRVPDRYADTTALALPRQAADTDGRARDRIPWGRAESAALVRELAALEEVGTAVADRSFYAQAFLGGRPVEDEGALEAGHGFAAAGLAPYRVVEGRAPSADREVVVDRALGVAAGTKLTVNLSEGRRDFTVVGTLDGPGYWFTETFAAGQQPGVRAIGLTAADGVSGAELAAAAEPVLDGTGTVVVGDGRSAAQPAHLAHKRFLGAQLLGAMALLALFTTVFTVAATLALATGLRRRELGLLRALGASPGRIRRMILGEAALLAVAGSAVGVPVGLAGAPLLLSVLRRLGVAAPDLALRVSAWPLLTAAGIGVAVCVLGAWTAARQAARVAPLEAMLPTRGANRPLSRARTVCGLVALAGGGALTAATAVTGADDRVNAALSATMVLIVAAALLAPVVVGPLARALTRPLARSRGAQPLLVRGELTAHPGRAAALAAPVIAAVGFAVLLTGAVETMRVAYPAGEALKLAGRVIVVPDGTPGNTEEVVEAHPVGKAAVPTRAFVTAGGAAEQTVVDVIGSRDPRWNAPGSAVLGARTADDLGLRAGDRAPVRFADGRTVVLRVAEVLPDDPARGDFVVARSLVREHDPAALTDDLFVPVAHAPASAHPGTAVHDAVRFALEDYRVDAELTESLAWLLVAVAVGYSAIAVANGTAAAAHSRRRDLAVLRATGGTGRQLLRTAAAETALVVGVGGMLGIAVAVPPLLGMASGLSQLTGVGIGLRLNLPAVTGVVAATLLVAVAAALVTTRRTLRRTPR